ncbi:hypothetical protein EDL80_00370 [Ehrlichia ruminantium]|uniref:Uncharacterized protein n=1 Tax=Ehrlichia ruminantium TaxID=779 RepID=A0AAE6Q9P6_EHRRU|nr:hypothetical protein [Ehrlichia ruminantium]QGR03075.1 hypothetical protein EDL80_00370 [Ehrlichia ruminantium]
MFHQKLDMVYIDQFIQDQPKSKVTRSEKTVSLSYETIWNYLCDIGLITYKSYNAYTKYIKAYHPDYNVFYGITLCDPRVFLEEIKIPQSGGMLSKIQEDYKDCHSLELYILNGYVLSVLVNDPLFEQFRSKIISIKMGDIDLFQNVYNDLKQNSNGCSEEDINFLVRGVMTDAHIEKYISLFPSLIELDCVISEPKCSETLVRVLDDIPILSGLSLRCANSVPSIECFDKNISIKQQVEKLLLINCPMDMLLYFCGMQFLFIIAPQNLPSNGVVLFKKYCDVPDLVEVLLVSTNSYSRMPGGKIVSLTVDYDISIFKNLKLLLINPCQDIRTIISIDGLFDSKDGLAFCNKLITTKKFNVLLNQGKEYPKSIEKILILSSPLHKFYSLADNEKLLFPNLECVFVSAPLVRACLSINTLVPYLFYSIDCIKGGVVNRNLNRQENAQLIILLYSIKKKVGSLLFHVLDNDLLCSDIASYLKRIDMKELLQDSSVFHNMTLSDMLSNSVLFNVTIDIPMMSAEFLKVFCSIPLVIKVKIQYLDNLSFSQHIMLFSLFSIRSAIRSAVNLSDKCCILTLKDWNNFMANISVSDKDFEIIKNILPNFPEGLRNEHNVRGCVKKVSTLIVDTLSKYSVVVIQDFVDKNVMVSERHFVMCVAGFVISRCIQMINSFVEGFKVQSCDPHLFIRMLRSTVGSICDDSLFDVVTFNQSFCKITKIITQTFNKRNFLTYVDILKFANLCIINDEKLIRSLKSQGFNKIDIQMFKAALFVFKMLNNANFSPNQIFFIIENSQDKKNPWMTLNVMYQSLYDTVQTGYEYLKGMTSISLIFFFIIDKAVSAGKISSRLLHKMLCSIIVESVSEILSGDSTHILEISSFIKSMIKLSYDVERSNTDTEHACIVKFIVDLCVAIGIQEQKFCYGLTEEFFEELPADVIDEIRLLGGISRKSVIQICSAMFFREIIKTTVMSNEVLANDWANVLKSVSPSNFESIEFRPMIQEFQVLYSGLVGSTCFLCRDEYEYAVRQLYPVVNSEEKHFCEDIHNIIADLSLKKMVYSYVICDMERKVLLRQLLLKLIYKFQEYSTANFVEYSTQFIGVLSYDVGGFIYENPSHHNMQFLWMLKNIKPSTIISLIDSNIAEYGERNNPVELYNAIVMSGKRLCKGSLPDLPAQFVQGRFIKFYYKILGIICDLHCQQSELSDNGLIKIIKIVLDANKIFYHKSSHIYKCASNLEFCNDETKEVVDRCKKWICALKDNTLYNDSTIIDIAAIKQDLLNKCQDIEFVKTLNYRVVSAYLKPYMGSIHYCSDMVDHIIFSVVGQVIGNNRDIFFEKLTDALISKKKLNTIQNFSEVVLEVFTKLLENNEVSSQKKEVILKKGSKQKKACDLSVYIDGLLNKYLCKWWYTILDNIFCNKSLEQSIGLYTIESFVYEEGLSVKTELAFRQKIEAEEANEYLILINKLKAICCYQESAASCVNCYPINNGVLSNIIARIKCPATDAEKKEALLQRVVKEGSIVFPKELDHTKLQIGARLYYATNMNIYNLKFIYLLQVCLFDEFFYHSDCTFDINVLNKQARKVLVIADHNSEFYCENEIYFCINALRYVQGSTFYERDLHTPEMISFLSVNLAWDTVNILLYDLVFGNYLNDIASVLHYVEDRFKTENQLDDAVMLPLRFHYKTVLLQYKEENTNANNPIIFLCKFLKLFNYDLLEYYIPGYGVNSQSVKKRSGTVCADVKPELIKSTHKKKNTNKKSKSAKVVQVIQDTSDEVLVGTPEVDVKSQSSFVGQQIHIVQKVCDINSVHLNDASKDECYEEATGVTIREDYVTAGESVTVPVNDASKDECYEEATGVTIREDYVTAGESVTVPVNDASKDECYEEATGASIKRDCITAGESVTVPVNDASKDECYEEATAVTIKEDYVTAGESVTVPVSNDEYLKQGAKPKIKELSSKKKKSKKSSAVCTAKPMIPVLQEGNLKKDIIMKNVDNVTLLKDDKVSKRSKAQLICIEEKDKLHLIDMCASEHTVSIPEQNNEVVSAVINDVGQTLLDGNTATVYDDDHLVFEETTAELCTSNDTLDMVSSDSLQSLEICQAEDVPVDDVVLLGSNSANNSILQKKQQKKGQLTKSQRQRANRKARKVREQTDSVGIQIEEKSHLIECCELKHEKTLDSNLLSCFDGEVGPVVPCDVMRFQYVLDKYLVTTASMCKTRSSHLLYYLRLTGSLFMLVKSERSSVLVVTESAEKALKDFFAERSQYDFFLSMIKLSILTNFLMIIRPNSKFEEMTALFKHYYKVFTMDLDAFLLDVIQELCCINSKGISLDKLRDRILRVFEKYESQFCTQGYYIKEYPLDFLARILEICPLVSKVECVNLSELHTIIYSAGVVCIVTHIGHIVQQSCKIFYYRANSIRRDVKSSFVFDFIRQCYAFRNTSCHLYDGKVVNTNIDFFSMVSNIIANFQTFVQYDSGNSLCIMYDFFRQYSSFIEKKNKISSKRQGSIRIIKANPVKLVPRVISHEQATHKLVSELPNSASSQVSELFPKVKTPLILGDSAVVQNIAEVDTSSRTILNAGEAVEESSENSSRNGSCETHLMFDESMNSNIGSTVESFSMQQQEYEDSNLLQSLTLLQASREDLSCIEQDINSIAQNSSIRQESIEDMFLRLTEDNLQSVDTVDSTELSSLPQVSDIVPTCLDSDKVFVNPPNKLGDQTDKRDCCLPDYGMDYSCLSSSGDTGRVIKSFESNLQCYTNSYSGYNIFDPLLPKQKASNSVPNLQQSGTDKGYSTEGNLDQNLPYHPADAYGERGMRYPLLPQGSTDDSAVANGSRLDLQQGVTGKYSIRGNLGQDLPYHSAGAYSERRMHYPLLPRGSTGDSAVANGSRLDLQQGVTGKYSIRGNLGQDLPYHSAGAYSERRMHYPLLPHPLLPQGSTDDSAVANVSRLNLQQGVTGKYGIRGTLNQNLPYHPADAYGERGMHYPLLPQGSTGDSAVENSSRLNLQQGATGKYGIRGTLNQNLPYHPADAYGERGMHYPLLPQGSTGDSAVANGSRLNLQQGVTGKYSIRGNLGQDLPYHLAGAYSERGMHYPLLPQGSTDDSAVANGSRLNLQQGATGKYGIRGTLNQNLPYHLADAYGERGIHYPLLPQGSTDDSAVANGSRLNLQQGATSKYGIRGNLGQDLPYHLADAYGERGIHYPLLPHPLLPQGSTGDSAVANSSRQDLQQGATGKYSIRGDLGQDLPYHLAGAYSERGMHYPLLPQGSTDDSAVANGSRLDLQQSNPGRGKYAVKGNVGQNLQRHQVSTYGKYRVCNPLSRKKRTDSVITANDGIALDVRWRNTRTYYMNRHVIRNPVLADLPIRESRGSSQRPLMSNSLRGNPRDANKPSSNIPLNLQSTRVSKTSSVRYV